MLIHPIPRFNVSSHSEASQLYEIEELAFAAYVRNLSCIRYHFHYHSTNLNIHPIIVMRPTEVLFSLCERISVYSRSTVDNDQDNFVDRKRVKLTSLSPEVPLSFLYRSSTKICQLSSIGSESSSLVSSLINIFLTRSIVVNDQDSLVDRK
jgi:hypothetical protein